MTNASDVLSELWLGEVRVDPEMTKAFAKSDFLPVLTLAQDNALLI